MARTNNAKVDGDDSVNESVYWNKPNLTIPVESSRYEERRRSRRVAKGSATLAPE